MLSNKRIVERIKNFQVSIFKTFVSFIPNHWIYLRKLRYSRKIDLRLLNWIYVLAGLVGLYTLFRNHGIVVAKTIHCVSIAVAIYSIAFYCVTLFRVITMTSKSYNVVGFPGGCLQFPFLNGKFYDALKFNFCT